MWETLKGKIEKKWDVAEVDTERMERFRGFSVCAKAFPMARKGRDNARKALTGRKWTRRVGISNSVLHLPRIYDARSMNIGYTKGLTLLLLVRLLSACHSEGKEVEENPIRFDSMVIEKTFPIENNKEAAPQERLLKIRFTYPTEYADKAVLQAVQQLFVKSLLGDRYMTMSVQEAVNKYAEDYGAQVNQETSDFEQDTEAGFGIATDFEGDDFDTSDRPALPEYELLNDSILYNQKNLLCYSVYREYCVGTPAANRLYTNWVVDLKTGKRVTEGDIFNEDYKDDLAKIIVDAIALSNNVDKVADLENIGFYNINEIYPNRNFYVDDVGVTYTFNENDIAAGALGTTTVRIPYEKLRHLLRRESPIAHLVF